MTLKSTDCLTIMQKEVRLGDPHVNSDDRNNLSILLNIYEPLVTYGENGEFHPCLAESWTLDEDACTWTFGLRSGVRFQDASPFSAGDVIASMQRVLSPHMSGELGTQSLYRSYLGDAHIEALDRMTVRIRTPEPMADLLDLMAKFPIAPESALDGLPGKPVGSGPYCFNGMENGEIHLTANEFYWQGTPPVQKLVWRAEPNAEVRVESLLDGRADLVADVKPEGVQKLLIRQDLTLVSLPSSVCTIFMCNIQNGVCRDRRVRQALNYAIDIPAIIDKVMKGFATPLNGPLASMHLGYDSSTPAYPYNVEKARALLAEAGYSGGVKLTLDVPSILPDEALAVAEEMKNQYALAGIETEIKVFHDRPAYATMVREKRIDDACAFDSSPLSTYQIFVDKFHSGLHGAWWQGYANPEVDALINLARRTPDLPARRETYRQVYRILREDAPWIFLFNPTLTWGLGDKAKGWRPTADMLIHMGPG